MIRSLFARGARSWRLLALGAALALGLTGIAGLAGAQAGTGTTTTTTQPVQNSGNQDEPVAGVRRTFRLFGLADQAITGLRQGGRTSWKTTASGPSDDLPTLDADLSGRVIGTASSRNGYCCGYFELQLWAASARGDWARARDQIPSLENITGGNGYNARTQLSRWVTDPQQLVWNGRDGSIGSLFSGVTTTSGDGSCRDNSRRANSVIGAGQQLLAGSDCPPTWAGGVFRGETVVDDTTWLNDFRALGNAFTWDDYKYPTSRRNPTRLYGAFQTYGATNDFGREVLLRAGNVIPGGSGKSNLEGFPMGIEWEWNVWTYAVPSLGDVMFYKANVINRSAQVYGTPINYDSLFLGFMVRPFHTTSTQAPAVYAAPERGAVLSAQGNANATNCYGNKIQGTDIRTCITSNTGFNGGAGAIVFLKSPIGDLRNKLFSRPTSAFYAPGHPLAGDTLTYNIMTSCGFTCATQQITPGRVRAAYGGIVGDVANALGGRGVTAAELSQRQYHDLIRNPDWPARWSAATGTQGAHAKYVPPGNWDYNHDGLLDTLTVTTCWNSALTANYTGTPANGCVRPWSDTLPGGFPNNFHNNYFAGVGPIKLHGGDTTSFIVAFVSVPDSISIERQVNDVIDLYSSFWLSPQPPQQVQVVSASVVGGNRQYDTEVRMFLDQSANTQSDPFVLEAARKLKSSTDANDIRLRVFNPWLYNAIRARGLPAGRSLRDTVARDTLVERAGTCRTAYTAAACIIDSTTSLGVVDSILVFKSCDGGTTYTATGGAACLPAPARDVASGNPSGYNWQSYSRLGKDANTGLWPSQFRDGNVTGGVTYTYVFVAQAYPVSFQVVDNIGGRPGVREYLVRTKTQNGLTANTANRNVATVYVPASTQAGGATSRAVVTNVSMAGFFPSDTGSAINASIRLARPLRGGQPVAAKIMYSDSATVRIFDRDTTVAGIDSTVVELHELVADSINGTTVVRRRAGRTMRFLVPGNAPAVEIAPRQIGTSNIVTSTAVSGTSKTVTYAYGFSAFNRPQVTLVVAGVPQYVAESDASTAARDLTPGNTTARTDFVGALVTHGNPTFAGTPIASAWRLPGIPLLRADANPTIRWLDATNRDSLGYGRYKIEFNDTEFGPLAPFRYDPRNAAAIRATYTESLNGRGIADATVTTAAAAAAMNAGLNRTNITTDSLAALTLPFTVRNLRFGRPVSVVALRNAHPASALLGSSSDTVRVPVPSNRWIPGEQLYFLESVPSYRYDTLSTAPLVRRIRRLANGDPDTTSVFKMTWGPVRLGCDLPAAPVTPTASCNPLTGFAATGYTLANKNQSYDLIWYAPLRGLVTADVTLLPEAAGEQIASVPSSALGNVRAVPNPYIMYSEYEQTNGTKRMMFVGLPPKGNLRIFTASGQFVQQINWVEADLEKNCRATTATTQCVATGDLTWNMRTREDKEIGPGFYMFVVSTDVGGRKQEKIGKFVIIH